MFLTTAALTVFAVLSIIGTYFVNKYWYPPVLTINDQDIAAKVILTTNKGEVEITIDSRSRFAAAQFTRLARNGFYTGNRIHRIVPDLLIETGDPLSRDISLRHLWGQGGTANAFKNQIRKDNRMTAGTVAFSSGGENTFDSQFFILTKDTPWLNGKHTIIGHVTGGMEIVYTIQHLPHTATGLPLENVTIEKISAL